MKLNLIGKWSSYPCSGYGGMEDTTLAFLPDGSGWRERASLAGCEISTFTWRVENETLVIDYQKYFLTTLRYEVESSEESAFGQEKSSIAIAVEETQFGGTVEVLTTENTIFLNKKFALVTRDENDLVFPLQKPSL